MATSGLGGPAGRTLQPRLLITLQAASERVACRLHTWAPSPAAALTAGEEWVLGDSQVPGGTQALPLGGGGHLPRGTVHPPPAVQPPLSEEKGLERHGMVAVVRNPTTVWPRSPLSGP